MASRSTRVRNALRTIQNREGTARVDRRRRRPTTVDTALVGAARELLRIVREQQREITALRRRGEE